MKFTEHNEIVMEKFASMIIERIEKMQASDWKQGWIGRTIGGSPVNIEGNRYQGCNVFWLMMDCALNNWEHPIYCTLKQASVPMSTKALSPCLSSSGIIPSPLLPANVSLLTPTIR